jgi:hypothetical protein
MPSAPGIALWTEALDDLPAGPVREAFGSWARTEQWIPTPAEIRARAAGRVEWLADLLADCRAAIERFAAEREK